MCVSIGRARVPGELLGEAGTRRREFHDTLHEADENDDMHRNDNSTAEDTIPARATMALHRFLSGLYTAYTRPLLGPNPPCLSTPSPFTIPNSLFNPPAHAAPGRRLKGSVW